MAPFLYYSVCEAIFTVNKAVRCTQYVGLRQREEKELWLLETNPPEMEDSLQLFVGSIQKAVRPGRPALIYGGHGRHVLLQAQEVFLHLE